MYLLQTGGTMRCWLTAHGFVYGMISASVADLSSGIPSRKIEEYQTPIKGLNELVFSGPH
jgi:hypothetical protein